MSADILLYWLSHVGQGTWTAFKKAVHQLSREAVEQDASYAQKLRSRLSDLGHVDLQPYTGSWKVCPSALISLPHRPGQAILCGARVPRLETALSEAAVRHGCEAATNALPDVPSRILVTGGESAMMAAASDVGIVYCRNHALYLTRELLPILDMLSGMPQQAEPLNWVPYSLELPGCKWAEGIHPDAAAIKYESRASGRSDYLVRVGEGWVRLPMREAIYAAAVLTKTRLARYSRSSRALSVPARAPLPADFGRAACLCSGMPPRLESGRYVYPEVPADVAVPLLVALGQPHPGFFWFEEQTQIIPRPS